ncbi:MAG TPA: hypothetical protein VHH36_00955 [Candidatus Thermoplasmatota archaeon]|nr:hypothetical protein [Candidatus Thermoplasmatota archaeon]
MRAFPPAVAALLATLAWGSRRLRPWTWPLTLACRFVGVAAAACGEVSIGIPAPPGAINAAVAVYAATRPVRRAYGR